MPCCNLVQIPEESFQGRYRLLHIELEVNVVGVLAQLVQDGAEHDKTIHAYVRVSSSSRFAIARATEVFPTPFLPVTRIADTAVHTVERYRKYPIRESHTSVHHLVERMESEISKELIGTSLKNVLHAGEYNVRQG